MIADWTVDVSPLSPSIDVPWEGWIDLRWGEKMGPAWNEIGARALTECQAYPELVQLLKDINHGITTATSKLDVFPVTPEDADPEIAEQGEPATRHGLGSYVDVFSAPPGSLERFEDFEEIARSTSRALTNLANGRSGIGPRTTAEIVVRPANILGSPTYAWTLYAMGFGPTAVAARASWKRANAGLLTIFKQQLTVFLLQRVPATYPSTVSTTRASSSIG